MMLLTNLRTMITRVVLVFLLLSANTPQTRHYTWKQTLEAIRQVETGGTANKGLGIIGDGGKALGPYQIHKAYWIDGNRAKGKYQDCLNDAKYSAQVVFGYAHKYSRDEAIRLQNNSGYKKDVETIARKHNAGPRALSRRRIHLTDKYWAKIQKVLK